MTTQPERSSREAREMVDPFTGKAVEISARLTDRLRGKYACGPTLPNGEPEFGWRQLPSPPIQAEAADRIEADAKRILELERERDKAVRAKEFTQQWYAERIEPIKDLAKAAGIWPQVAAVLANGPNPPDTPPTYAQQLNSAKGRATRAEAQVVALRGALKSTVKQLRSVLGDAHAGDGDGGRSARPEAFEALKRARTALAASQVEGQS